MSFLYHVANQKFRKQISVEGLRGHQLAPIWRHDNQPKGNYGFQFLEDALEYRLMVIDKFSELQDQDNVEEHCDIWRIDTLNIIPLFDPETRLKRGEVEPVVGCMEGVCKCHSKAASRWYINHLIEPEAFTLLDQDEYDDILVDELPTYFKWCSARVRMQPPPDWQ